jgi:hypothetical protein
MAQLGSTCEFSGAEILVSRWRMRCDVYVLGDDSFPRASPVAQAEVQILQPETGYYGSACLASPDGHS